MKKYFFMAVAAIAALSSCSNNDEFEPKQTGNQGLVFTATMEGSEGTRATYDATNKCASWETTDQISINGKTYNAQSAGLTTTFKAETEGQEAEGPTYNAYFACTYDGTTATLPSAVSETWADGKFNMPMYATSTTTNLEFKNLCGVLKIKVKSDQIAAVKSIRVSSADKAVSGAFTVDANNAAVLTNASTVANNLTVTYSAAVTTDAEGKVFYVAVPAQTYQELKIELDADGNGFTKSMTTKSATNITVERNKIYPITFADNAAPATTGTAKAKIGGIEVDVKWVQLWENGPKFAEYNVGVTDGKAESCGKFYAWGETEETNTHNWSTYKWTDYSGSGNPSDDQFTKYSSTDNKKVLEAEDDPATANWGSKWRTPVKADFERLITNCDIEFTTVNNIMGYKVKGRGDYNLNYIFLPSYSTWTNWRPSNTESGNYGTATLSSNNCLGYEVLEMWTWDVEAGLYFGSTKYRWVGTLVRAVIKE